MGKRIIAFLLSISIVLTMCSGVSFATDTEVETATEQKIVQENQAAATLDNGLEYEIYDTYCEITGYSGDATEVVIPGEIEGISVASIGDYAFGGCRGLTSIEIPTSVTNIGDYAFANCDGLTSLELPACITNIGDSAFVYCDKLTNIELPNGVTNIGDCTFAWCGELANVNIPDGVVSIGIAAFEGCGNIVCIKIPASITYISESAFANCSSLTTVYYEGTSEQWHDISIGDINEELTSAEVIFTTSESTLPSGEGEYGDFVYYNYGTYCGITRYTGSDTDVIIPSEIDGVPVTSIGAFAFCENVNITSVSIPKGVTLIESYAFDGCSNLKEVNIPDSVTEIWDQAFSNCTSLTSISIPDSVTRLSYASFMNCTNLETIKLSDNLSMISFNTFDNCSSLKEIKIPDSVTSIGSNAFSDCSSLISLTIPENVTSIGSYAFIGCDKLESITVAPENTAYYSENNCLIQVEDKTLRFGCKNSVIPSDGSVTIIGAGAFDGCSELSSIVIPDGVTTIESFAFAECSGLTSVTIPSSVIDIEDYAFQESSNLETVYYIGTPEQWNSISVGSENEYLLSAEIIFLQTTDNFTYMNYGSHCEIINYIGTATEVEIPSEIADVPVAAIGSGAFSGCAGVTKVIIPASVTQIGETAFAGCDNLEKLCYEGSAEEWAEIVGDNDSLAEIEKEYNYGAPEKALVSISVTTQPNKVTYLIGETMDTTGLGITLTYSDESTEIISDGFEVSGFDSETAGEKTITVTYEGMTATFTVTVNESQPDREIVFGDADEDGFISALDAMTVLQFSVEIIGEDAIDMVAADVDGSGAIDAIDAMLMLQYDVELIEKFPVEE